MIFMPYCSSRAFFTDVACPEVCSLHGQRVETASKFGGDVFTLRVRGDGALQTCRIILDRYRYIGDSRAGRVSNDTPNRSRRLLRHERHRQQANDYQG